MSSHSASPTTAPHDAARPLAVLAVTYNSADTLGGLLDSLADGLVGIAHTEVVIADNASADASVTVALKHPVGARVVQLGWNGGYAAGINGALATIAPLADVLIVNPDIRLLPGAAALLVARLRDARIGIAVPHVLHEDGTLVHSLRREPSLQTAWADALLGSKLGSGLDWGECVSNSARYEVPGLFDWASGAVLAVSGEARASIGAWDESFFLYSEEVDFQRRSRLAGFRIAYVPEAKVIHLGGDYNRNAGLYSILTANRIRDYARHHGRFSRGLFRTAVLVGEVVRSFGGSPVHRAGVLAALRRPPERHVSPPHAQKAVQT